MGARTRMPMRAALFDDRHRPTWIVATNPWHKIEEVRALPVGTDLMREFIVEALRYHDEGWRLVELSSFSAYFFASKERYLNRCVSIVLEDPATALLPAGGQLGPAANRVRRVLPD